MDALAMTWPDESFDLVWACESGEHMPDKKKYVEEMTRVLKPGGTLVIACWCQREEGDKCAAQPLCLLFCLELLIIQIEQDQNVSPSLFFFATV
jgi:ubiquinone/menaquinone biosynthesis C-methylase UbiE